MCDLTNKIDNMIINEEIEDSNIKLSNLFYEKKQIEISFITSLLNYNDDASEEIKDLIIKECLFWINEHFKSDFITDNSINHDTFNLIFKVYFDFYSIINPKFINYINKKYALCENLNFDYDTCFTHINQIVFNMCLLEYSPIIFILRQVCVNFNNDESQFKIKKLYRHSKNNTWLECYDKSFHNLLLSINKNNYYYILYYLLYYLNNNMFYDNENEEQYDCLYYQLIHYFTNIKNVVVLDLDFIDDKWNNLKYIFKNKAYNNIFHYFLTFIIHMNISEEYIFIEKVYFALEPIYNDFIYNIFGSENECNIEAYNILKIKRLFEINNYCSCFENDINYDDNKEIILNNTLYLTLNSNIWLKRIYEYDGVIDHLNMNIIFDEENINIETQETNFDSFHNKYNYELEEQSIYIQNKSLKKLNNKLNYNDWLNNVFEGFNVNDIINIDDYFENFIFKY